MARKFFLVCAGMFLLALSYHLGAGNATAQTGGQIVGFAHDGNTFFVVTSNGDIFWSNAPSFDGPLDPVRLTGNIWAGGATNTVHTSWGQAKARFH
jgi:hypothetical protein